MLKLVDIKKDYLAGENQVHALKGVSLSFREQEFVSILGQSGCGKTTLLNIIGGLDQYTSGDLIINGISTKKYGDRDWDTYRNHTIGFVFQSYNLIPHQTVLSNVELALTLSGVSKEERIKRSKEALEKVGLSDQIFKKPNQLSGGQMQRVAIARALVNNPDVLLADEPTGALDTETSVQIMELLKEVASEKLVIMVTHNPELADRYSTRIIKLLDGKIIGDTSPYDENKPDAHVYDSKNAAAKGAGDAAGLDANDDKAGKKTAEKDQPEVSKTASVKQTGSDNSKVSQADMTTGKGKGKKSKTSMGFFTALALSLNNLMTKKGRTILTAFAGSIGIIGIALIMSISNGIQNYIDTMEEDTLSAYPIMIQEEVVDMSSLLEMMMGEDKTEHDDLSKVYSKNMMGKALQTMVAESKSNNMEDFKAWLDSSSDIKDCTNAIQYSYNVNPMIYLENGDAPLQVNPFDISGMGMSFDSSSAMSTMYNTYSTTNNTWVEMIDNRELLETQYEVVSGKWPEGDSEAVLVVNDKNEVFDLTLYAMGIKDAKELYSMFFKAISSLGDKDFAESIDSEEVVLEFDQIVGKTFKLVLPTDLYEYDEASNSYVDMRNNASYVKNILPKSKDVKIVGIIRIRPDAVSTSLRTGSIAYTRELTESYVKAIQESELVKKQLANPDTDIISGLPFEGDEKQSYTNDEKAKLFSEYALGLSVQDKASLFLKIYSAPSSAEITAMAEQYMQDYPDRASRQQFMVGTLIDVMHKVQKGELKLEYLGASGLDENTLNQMLEMSDEELAAMLEQMYIKIDDAQFNMLFETSIRQVVEQMYTAELAGKLESYTYEQLADMLDNYIPTKNNAELAAMFDKYMPAMYSSTTYDDNMSAFGLCYMEKPSMISIYAKSFDDKEKLQKLIEDYNAGKDEAEKITYTDYVGIIMKSITRIVNIISYVLIAFVSISLVVSSIMIGIITYISVLERTKEIGILRAIGASKRDIRWVFNSEAITIGFISGIIGIGITLLLNIPISAIIKNLTDVGGIAKLPWIGGFSLVLISMFLTFIAGLIPSSFAAKKDPVIALRSE